MFPFMMHLLKLWVLASFALLVLWVGLYEIVRYLQRRESRAALQRKLRARAWAKAELERFERRG